MAVRSHSSKDLPIKEWSAKSLKDKSIRNKPIGLPRWIIFAFSTSVSKVDSGYRVRPSYRVHRYVSPIAETTCSAPFIQNGIDSSDILSMRDGLTKVNTQARPASFSKARFVKQQNLASEEGLKKL
jgi:hypothetical protein